MNKADKAVDLRRKSNCCQAVLLAYADELGMEENTLISLGSGFGSGMGCMEGNCGALCGACMVAGLLNKSGRPATIYSRAILAEFKQKCGSTICADIKGVGTGRILCSCDDCVRNAVEALEKLRG